MKILLIIVGVLAVAGIVWFALSGNNNNANTNTTNTTLNTSTLTNTSVNLNTNLNTNAGLNVNSSVTNSSTSVNAAANTNSSANTNTATISQGKTVNITSSGFIPQTVTITAGQTVTWLNNDTASHQVAPNPHPTHDAYPGIWDDPKQIEAPGDMYQKTFNTAGTYGYHDHTNPSVTGTVIVQ